MKVKYEKVRGNLLDKNVFRVILRYMPNAKANTKVCLSYSLSGQRFLTKSDLLKKSGFKEKRKMLDYVCYVHRLIPRPIKSSRGNGIVALYPEFVLPHLKHVVREKEKGLNYPEIGKKLAKETEKVFVETERIRKLFEAERSARLDLSEDLRFGRPDFVYSEKGTGKTYIVETKIQNLKKEIKEDFRRWDGSSLDELGSIKQKIENLEVLQARERVKEALLHTV